MSPERSLRSKQLDLDEAAREVARWRASGERVVLARGDFDLLHVGHLHYLRAARELGTRLIVAVEEDDPRRAFISTTDERATLVAALRIVDRVTRFAIDRWMECASTLAPDVIALAEAEGGASPPARLPEAADARRSTLVGIPIDRVLPSREERIARVRSRAGRAGG